ncbi:MAG: CotS family spore coat protein, partial [Clostridiaceae bacterium]
MDKALEILENSYGLKIYSAIKEKSVYKVYSEEGCYCFKLIGYKYSHFKFIISTMKHLENRG